MAAGPNHSIFTGSRATARVASFLQGRRPRGGIIPNKNEGILFRDTSAERRSEDGTFSLSWGVPWGPPRPPNAVLKIRGGHLLRWPSPIFKASLAGLGGPQGTPRERENAPSSLLRSALASRHRIPSFLKGSMPPRGLLHCKYETIRAVARDPFKME